MSPDTPNSNSRFIAWMALVACAMGLYSGGAAHAAGLLIADGGLGGNLEIKDQQVHVTINNGVAVTEVEQVFLNKENRIVEALYTFPVPGGASVSNFSMWINGKEMIGEVVEKQRAREIYESYKKVRRDPGLLEQVDYKRFEMRIFPIAAGAEQKVRVTYYQQLETDHDWCSYVYPLATITRPGLNSRTQGRFALTVDARSEVPITLMKSPSHGDQFVMVQQGSPNYHQASLEVREGDLNRDVVIAYHIERPRTGIDVIAAKQPSEDGYFLATLTAGKELEEVGQGADYVFVVDVSGSMAFDGKLGMSQRSVEQFIESLGDQDRFEVVAFNVAASPLYGQLSPANAEAKSKATTFLGSQQARGGTILRPAVELAYRYRQDDRPLNVVILSDGMTEQREQQELLAAAAKRPAGTSLFCVGVGNEVNRPLLTQLAQDAGGLAAFVSQSDDFQRQAEAFRRKLTRPAMTDVKVSFAGASVYDVEPQQLPNLYHGQPLRIIGRYRVGGPTAIKLTANVLGRPTEMVTEVKLPERDDNNPEIERMWAYQRVTRLMEEARRDGKAEQLKPEIVRLCEGYSIASEYASFIVLENDAEYQRWKIERRNVTRVARDRAAQDAVRTQLAELRDKAARELGPAPADKIAKPVGSANPATENVAASQPRTQPQSQPVERSMERNVGPIEVAQAPRSGGGGGGGGGAIDPLTALVACGVAGAAALARRRSGQAGQSQAA